MRCTCGQASKNECKQMFDEILAKEFSDYRYSRVHRLTVDAYSLQHPDKYMKSAKSFAAHLTGMCVAMEFEGNPDLLRALQQWLSGTIDLPRPEPPDFRGTLTVSHILGTEDAGGHHGRVQAWARDVWAAWQEHHDIARRWVLQVWEK